MNNCLFCNSDISYRARANVIKFCNDRCKNRYYYNSYESKIRRNLRIRYAKLLFNSNKCFYCNKLFNNDKTIEHIIPDLDLENLNIVVVCKNCNTSKGKKDLLEWAKSKDLKISNEILNLYNKLKENQAKMQRKRDKKVILFINFTFSKFQTPMSDNKRLYKSKYLYFYK